MSQDLAAFLDDLSLHIEREISKVPAPVAQALLRDDSPFSTVEMLRILAQPERAADLIGANAGTGAPFPETGKAAARAT